MSTNTLNPNEIMQVIQKAIHTEKTCIMSHLTRGKWHRLETRMRSINRKTLMLELISTFPKGSEIQIDQPAGMSFEMDFSKYIFDTSVIGFEPAVNDEQLGKVMIKRPWAVEKMQRRSYKRAAVPAGLKVETIFWHRGYSDNTDAPLESYWQGNIVNLSAGGSQLKVNRNLRENFKTDQFIGMQFTPLPNEKPILVEGQIKSITNADEDIETISLGIEFLGLEATAEGRSKLEKIVETVNAYQSRTFAESAVQN